MKFNKWTLGLAAVGAVSLASVAQAEEKATMVMTAVSSTTLSGYVDTSINWNTGTGNAVVPGYSFNTPAKQDGFNLDAVLVRVSKALDESEWAAGYDVDIFMGPDANFLGTSPIGGFAGSDFAIKQAYVSLRTPIAGTAGIDWKLGVFDNWIGYESTESPSNPNFTRSYGYTIEPTTFTGIMGTYKISDMISVSGGIVNTTTAAIGGDTAAGAIIGRSSPSKAESFKTYMGSVALTAPNDWGFLAGSSMYAGAIIGAPSIPAAAQGSQFNFYTGATLNTPVAGLKTGISYDYLDRTAGAPAADDIAIYTDYQANEKWSFHGRAEYFWGSSHAKVYALTGTVQYDLWKNVLSRLELRWDHIADGGTPGSSVPRYGGTTVATGSGIPGVLGGVQGGANNKVNSVILALNVVYKF